MTRYRLRRVDAVRLRLLPLQQVAALQAIADLRRQSIGKVLRILLRKFRGNVPAYWTAAFGVHAPMPRVPDRPATAAELRKLLRLLPPPPTCTCTTVRDPHCRCRP